MCQLSGVAIMDMSITLLVLVYWVAVSGSPLPQQDIHGGVQMGIASRTCDDAKTLLSVDWDSKSTYEHTCNKYEILPTPSHEAPNEECIPKEDIPLPLHKCMTTNITYDDSPPRAGPHRPLWPVYGEYRYIPPQRWIHSLEHAAAVFLYHPCADALEVKNLKTLARGCLRRHIITPFRGLPPHQPLAIVTYGCRLLMGKLDVRAAISYIKTHALRDGTEHVSRDGQYSEALIRKANVLHGSNMADTTLCPNVDEFGNGLNLDSVKVDSFSISRITDKAQETNDISKKMNLDHQHDSAKHAEEDVQPDVESDNDPSNFEEPEWLKYIM